MKATKEENIILRMNNGEAKKLVESLDIIRSITAPAEILHDFTPVTAIAVSQLTQFLNILRRACT